MELTHFDDSGKARMVDVSFKEDTVRIATAQGHILMNPNTYKLIQAGQITKGDVLTVARVAGIMAAKQTSSLIPMCHPLAITGIKVDFIMKEPDEIIIKAEVRVIGKTGVEMEALTAVSVAALTIYDMCKAIDKSMKITDICLLEKSGGKSGHYVREKS